MGYLLDVLEECLVFDWGEDAVSERAGETLRAKVHLAGELLLTR